MLTPPKQTESTILDPAISLQKQNKTAEPEESLIFDANIARGGISPLQAPTSSSSEKQSEGRPTFCTRRVQGYTESTGGST